MKSRYMPILYVGMVLAALAAVFYSLDRINRSLPRNPKKAWPTSALPAKMSEATLSKATLSEATLSDIRSMLEKQEYHISYDEQKKMLQSPNRAHNLRVYYEPGKFTVQNRVDTLGHHFKLELTNEGIFADGKPLHAPQPDARTEHQGNQVQIRHDAFTEEFINNEEGVRQNFIINHAPTDTRQLQVKMAVKGLKVRQGEGNELRFYTDSPDSPTPDELVYSDLQCWDVNRKPLAATLAGVKNQIVITVDVAHAVYPVTIDPIIANGNPNNANKIIQVDQSNMWLRYSVASAGDVNGDGYSDIILGAPRYDKGNTDEGAAFIYPGTPSGISLAAVTLECNQDSAKMGYVVASAGDFNGDGFSDVVVGAPFYDINGKDDGIAKLYFGSAQGISANATPMNFSTSNPGDNYGISVATAGDIDADGFSDILIGAHQSDVYQNNSGVISVTYGAASNFKIHDYIGIPKAEAKFGYSVASAGDVDGDGFSDIIVGARYYSNGAGQAGEGAAFIYRGSAAGLIETPVVIEGNQYDAAMGNKVSSAGDVNGDGYSDILISAFMHDNEHLNEGRVYLHLGSSTGIDPQPAKTFEGNQTDARMGSSIACAGDVNGDGYADIMLGASHYDNNHNNEGAVFIYHGTSGGIANSPASFLESNQGEGWFGTAVASAGDVNGDGYSDILVGCYTYENGQNDEGHVFAYYGGAEGVGQTGYTQVTSNNIGALIGFSVATAGDVNADGYSDVIVGAPYYDLGESNEGIAFVYYGSQSGLITATYHICRKTRPTLALGGLYQVQEM